MDRRRNPLKTGRRCAICKKPGGSGFTFALRLLGYDVPKSEMGYAHSRCIQQVKAKKTN